MIYQRHALMRSPYLAKPEQEIPLTMKGREVFRFAVTASLKGISDVLEANSLSKEDVSWYLIHQANLRIVDGIRGRLGVSEEKFPTNIADHGNSSSASCPILLDECRRKGIFKKGDLLIFSAFGAGLLSATALMEW